MKVQKHLQCSNVECASRHLGSPAFRLFVQLFVQADIKETWKLRTTGPLRGQLTGDRLQVNFP